MISAALARRRVVKLSQSLEPPGFPRLQSVPNWANAFIIKVNPLLSLTVR
jgi:hypothetical protein